ncbi:hypothetical protein RHGRI_005703 [Rhododendron griersonianum]|uniref:RNase H type-1 domain-containing protein n=1 Tax=Rhododendron griersonianum TaxID=479676 RepID=A0AAV6LEH2_9ERIC|nr:hypothetical protein RHGRI_005703 [Rhododendron griersonianum]
MTKTEEEEEVTDLFKTSSKRWIDWCNEYTQNVAHSGDDMSRQLTGPFLDFKVDLQRLARRMLAIDNSVRVFGKELELLAIQLIQFDPLCMEAAQQVREFQASSEAFVAVRAGILALQWANNKEVMKVCLYTDSMEFVKWLINPVAAPTLQLCSSLLF